MPKPAASTPKPGAKLPPAALAALPHLAARLRRVDEPVRALVLLTLGDGERHVGALCVAASLSMSAVSRHLALLRLDGLVEVRRDGQRNAYSLTDAGREMRRAIEALSG